MKFFKLLPIIAFSLLLFGCNNAAPIEVKQNAIEVSATGPLFSGVNTATADFKIVDLFPEGVTKESIESAKILSISVKPKVASAPKIISYTALLASPNEEMKQFAFFSKSGEGAVNLNVAEDQSFMEDILKDESQTLVIDFDLSEDWYEDWSFEVNINWELKVSK